MKTSRFVLRTLAPHCPTFAIRTIVLLAHIVQAPYVCVTARASTAFTQPHGFLSSLYRHRYLLIKLMILVIDQFKTVHGELVKIIDASVHLKLRRIVRVAL